MHERIVLDTSAWIDYFEGKRSAEVIRTLITARAIILVNGLILAECCSFARRSGVDPQKIASAILALSVWSEISPAAAELAAECYVNQRKLRPKFGLSDALMLAFARDAGARLITCDKDFHGLEGVTLL